MPGKSKNFPGQFFLLLLDIFRPTATLQRLLLTIVLLQARLTML